MNQTNNNTQHTPGTWVFRPYTMSEREHSEIAGFNIVTPEQQHIACCSARWMPEAETEANARLIAAAPSLLEALQNILANLDDMGVRVANRMQADAAIAKATGTR